MRAMAGTGSRMTFVAPAVLAATVGWWLSVFAGSALASSRVALVIGNATYVHAQALRNPLNDAEDIGDALKRLGYSVTRIKNAGYAELRRGLLNFSLAASASEKAVVFYAGHGIEVDGRNYLVPVDARLASDQVVELEAVPLELVSRMVERASRLRLVILDACRENPFAVSMRRAGATRAIGRGLARVEPSGDTVVAYAAKEGTVAADGTGRNSPYTKALLAHLEEPGVDVGKMFRKVRDAVLASTGRGQEPFTYGSLSGKDVFLGPAPEPAPSRQPSLASGSGPALVTAGDLATKRLRGDQELLFWESVKDSEDPADVQAYLDRYPDGTYAVLARNRLKRLKVSAGGDASPEPAVAVDASGKASAKELESSLGLGREERRWVQQGLELLGYSPGPADGRFGVRTRKAIRTYQKEKGEPETGYVTRAQSEALMAMTKEEAVRVKKESQRRERERLAEERRAAERRADDAAIARAKSLGTMEAYREYMSSYPGGRHVEEARERESALRAEAERLERERNLRALAEDAARVKKESRRRERERLAEERRAAERRADDAAYARAKSLGTVQAYGEYMSSNPGGRHVVDARQRESALREEAKRLERERDLRALAAEAARVKKESQRRERERLAEERRAAERRADDAAYARAKSLGTVQAYGEYMSSNPGGRHVVDARQRESALREEAKRLERERDLRALAAEAARVKKESQRRERERLAEERRAAERRADDAAYARAKSLGTVQAYGEYMSSNPGGRHVVDARQRESALREEAKRLERERKAPWKDCPECPELVVVPRGSYMMGSPRGEKGRYRNEGPVHRVTLSKPIAVGVYEVTRGEWSVFASETGHSAGSSCLMDEGGQWKKHSGSGWRNPGFSQEEREPVVCVSWEDTQAYVGWLSKKTGHAYRLLSESEWEYAARGGTSTSRYWGERRKGQCRHANGMDQAVKRRYGDWNWIIASCDDGHAHTSTVGSYRPNEYGLYDMLGNVWEWVGDCWHDSYKGAPADGSAWTRGEDCGRRVSRGGSWNYPPRNVRSAKRNGSYSGAKHNGTGFRVVRTLD